MHRELTRGEDPARTGHLARRRQIGSASGARLALGNPLNRVAASLDRPGTVTPDADGQGATVAIEGKGAVRLTLA